ncbi:MAG: DUF4124 domain-containing protein [Gammaproteobacteria bacterium]|jgi:hypothetical protein|nr:DUF4124 domain-containing protein [Gammaproteobacteria bacterium]MBQ0774088.1 DUF4124 domain-containing protein [Gammaproteobacteria bacterium]
MDQRDLGKQRRLPIRTIALVTLTLLVNVSLNTDVNAAGAYPLASGVYQWRDEQGRVHFGDAPNPEHNAKNLSADYDFSLPFKLVIEGIGKANGKTYRIPPKVEQSLGAYVSKIFTIYQQALDLEYPQTREFRIEIYGTEQAYRAYQQTVAPVLENSAGFYNPATNQITTWGMPAGQLQRLITHECSHAISASHGQYVPVWLNEGLAEYFEEMQVSGLGAQVPVSRQWLYVLKRRGYASSSASSTADLRAVIDSPHNLWYTANGADGVSYATSWSLVWFLMDSKQGRSIIAELLNTQHSPLGSSSSQFIERRWPGGFDRFSKDWQHWLRDAAGTHRY